MTQAFGAVRRRGSLYVVVLDKYEHYDELGRIRAAVQETIPALRLLGFEHDPADLVGQGTWAELQTGFESWRPAADRPVILYWTGHGRLVDERGDLCLLCANSPKSLIKETVEAMTAARLGGLIAERRIARTLLLIDACNAGGAAQEVAQAFNRRRTIGGEGEGAGLGLAVITSAWAGQAARELVFSGALRKVLTEDGSAFRSRDQWLTPDDLVDGLRAAMREEGQTPDISTDGSVGAVLRNPWYRPNQPDVLVAARESAATAIPAAGAEHFLLKFRGIDVLADQGWFFTGREHTWKQIRDWMAERDSGMFVLTGYPGGGKSALLGRLAVLSDPEMRAAASKAGVLGSEPSAAPPTSVALDAGIHARRLTLRECVEAFASALGVVAAEPRELLREVERLAADRLSERRGLVLMLDALDEAQRADRRNIATDLLRPLADLAGVKVLVGLRQELPEHGGPEQPQLSGLLRILAGRRDTVLAIHDDPRAEDDVKDYIVKRLVGTPGSPYWADPAAAELVGLPLALRCAGMFLPAQVFSRVLAHREHTEDPRTVADSTLFSPDLDRAYDEDLRRFDEEEESIRRILTPLAWAEGKGLPLRDVWGAVAVALRDMTWPGPTTGARPRLDAVSIGALIETAGAYLVEGSEDGQTVYRLYHDEFARYLRGSAEPGEVQRAVTRALLDLAGEAGRRDWAVASPYLRRYLAGHAEAAGLLGELIDDPVYLTYADPDRLTRELNAVDRHRHPLAQLYLRVAHRLSEMPPNQRAEVLLESALRDEPRLVGRLDRLPDLVWRGMASSAPPRLFHRTLPGHTSPVSTIGFARTAEHDLLVSRSGAAVHVWDLESGERLQTHNRLRTQLLPAAVGTTGTTAVIALAEAAGIGCWDVLTGQRVGLRFRPAVSVHGLVFGLVDGQAVIAVADGDGVDLVRPGADSPLRRIPTGRPRCVAMTDTGGRALLATVGDIAAGVWDAETGSRLGALPVKGAATCVAIRACQDGPEVAIGYRTGEIDYWQPADGQTRSLAGHGDQVLGLAFSSGPSGERLLVSGGADGTAALWDPATGRRRLLQERAGKVAVTAACDAGGNGVVATGSNDGDLRLWESPPVADDDDEDARFAPIPGRIIAVALSSGEGDPDVAIGTVGGTLQVRGPNCALLREFDLGDRAVSAVAFDGAMLAAATADGVIRVWRDGLLSEPVRWRCPAHYIRALTLDAAADRLVSAGADGVVRVWSARTGRAATPRKLAEAPVRALAAADEPGETLLAAACGGSVYFCRPGTPLLRKADTGRGVMLQSVALGRLDGGLVAAAGDQAGHITLIDVERLTPIRSFDGHSRNVHTLALGQLGGTAVLASASDGSVRLWDLLSGGELDRWTEGDSRSRIGAAAFRFDASRLLRVSATDHAVNLAYATDVPTSRDRGYRP